MGNPHCTVMMNVAVLGLLVLSSFSLGKHLLLTLEDGEDYTDSIEAGSDYSNPIPTLSVQEKFGKKYKSKAEEKKRFATFSKKVKLIDEHNLSGAPKKVGVNKFTDLTDSEMERYKDTHGSDYAAKRHKDGKLVYGFCDGAPQPVTIHEFSVSPDPVVLKPGAKVTVTGSVTTNVTMEKGTKVDVKILKEFLGVKIPIPCIPMEIKIGGKTIKRVGSCKHDADEILKLLDDIPSTPVPPGDYKGSKTVSIPDNILATVLGKGFYEVTANLINPDGSQLTCVEATMTAK